jgi:GntR family transcriptional regulator, rspAB operon transcriptional repressor
MSDNNIYKELKKQIISLEQKPGAIIREKEIMEAFNVSRTPVREALMRLEVDGLVRIIPNAGTFVEEISFQKLRDVFEVRAHLVRLAGKLAATRISNEEIIEVRRVIEDMKSTKDTRTLMKLDTEIHNIIRKATRNELLIKTLSGLHDQAVRIWNSVGTDSGYWEKLYLEFEDIVASLEQHDQESSARLLEEHANVFSEQLKNQLTFPAP